MDDDAVFGCTFVILCIIVGVIALIDYTLILKGILLLGVLGVWLIPVVLAVCLVIAFIIAIFNH